VATNGTDGAAPPWGESWDYPFATLSNAAARANASSGSVVLVSNGIYSVTNEIVFTNSAICRGWSGDPRDVVVDGCSTSRGFFIKDSAVAALTVTNCRPSNRDGDGGGIYGFAASMISNCVIAGNYGRYGGGVRVDDGGRVADCIIAGNRASGGGGGGRISGAPFLRNIVRDNISENKGGGIYISGAVVVGDCLIANNISTNSAGGGIYDGALAGLIANCQIVSNVVAGTNAAVGGAGCYVGYHSVYSNCVFAYNRLEVDITASYGGGGLLFAAWSQARLYNCLLDSNQAEYGAGAFCGIGTDTAWINCTVARNTASNTGGGMYIRSGTNSIANGILYGNTAAVGSNYYILTAVPVFSNSCAAPAPAGANDGGGNTNASPLFVDLDAGKFQLQPDSPCVNTGSNQPWMAGAFDLDGRFRVDRFSGRVDMGCYEYISRGTLFGFR